MESVVTMQERHCLELFSLSVDVEWCGLILPLCSRNFGTVVTSAAHDEDIDWAEFAESIGLVCRISSPQSVPSGFTFNVGAVKVAGVVILLGLGGYLCYKFCKYWDLGYLKTNELTGAVNDSDSPQPPQPPSVTPPSSNTLSSSPFHKGIKGDPSTKPIRFLNFQTKYFGPVHLNQDNKNNGAESSDSLHWDASDTTPSSESDGINSKDFAWPLTRENLSKHSYKSSRRNGYNRHNSHNQFSPPEYNRNAFPRRRGWLLQKVQSLATPDGNRSQHLIDLKEGCELDTNKLSPLECGYGTSTSTSSGSSPVCHPHFCHQSRILSRDLSYDSLVLLNHSRREGSIDSMSSDISLDLTSLADQTSDNSTVARMDKLQQEIDELKTNCLMMDEDFETIRCNRNLPGLSSLMESSERYNEDESDASKKESARACFKGLYSLTTINHSMSLDLSDSQPLSNDSNNEESPIHLNQNNNDLSSQIEEEPLPSLEWDEGPLDTTCEEVLDITYEDEDEQWNMATSVTSNLSNCDNNERSSVMDVSEYGSGQVNNERYSCPQMMTDSWESTVYSNENNNIQVPNRDISLNLVQNINRSSSHESGGGMSETWSWSSSMSVSDLGTPNSGSEHYNLPSSHLNNIGPRIDILPYAESEWRGNTERANIIRKGYAEIVNTLNYNYIRQIRGDNYCAIRGAIYQTLAQGLPVPSGKQAMKNLSNALDSNSPWLSNWKFANRLPHYGSNVRRGMEICLQTLDNVACLMMNSNSTNKERENSLMTLLNTDPTLDVHILEAVKLHMMVQAMELHSMYMQGNDVPLFSMLMFARDTSESPLDLMNNHLHLVGDTGGLEQVEMFLLGYTLGVTIKVVRPSAFGTQDFTCYYPDWNVGTWPEVLLIAEDDRHYNVLVQ